MTCQECRPQLIELARGRSSSTPTAHLEECDECLQFLVDQRALAAAFRVVAAQATDDPLPFLETRLLAEFDAAHAPRPRATRFWQLAAMSACLAAALVAILQTHPAFPVTQPAANDEQPFIEIPYVAPFAPYERAEVQRMNVPVGTLMAAGFAVAAPDPSVEVTASLPADVLVGQDGRVHAVRLLTSQEMKP
jgi:hypothetical protein